MEVNFKKANYDDRDLILELIREFYEIEHVEYNRQVLEKCLPEIFDSEQWGMLWLICVENEVAGYIFLTFGYSFELHGINALVDELYIREAYRLKGIGKKALKFVESVCESLGIKTMNLVVGYENEVAKNVYKKFGFTAYERYIMTKWIGGKNETDSGTM
ncbi:MAG TPA: GNAT family N-acetyltransferase [Leptolyngbyaceae cyanobacterium]